MHAKKAGFECQKLIGCASTTPHDWLKISRQFATQSEVKTKPIATISYSFYHALRQLLRVSVDCSTVMSVSFLNGLSYYFGFGFTTLELTLD